MVKLFFKKQKSSIIIGLLISLVLALWPFQKDVQLYYNNKKSIEKYEKVLNQLNNNDPKIKELRTLGNELFKDFTASQGLMKFIQNFIISLIVYFFISLVISYSLFLFDKSKEVLTNVDGSIHILDKANNVYKKIIENHNNISNPFDAYLSKKILETDYLGGFAFIKITDNIYAKWLLETLNSANSSYLSTMRLDPKLFLEFSISNNEIIEFNKKFFSKDLTNKIIKRRVLIYEEKEFYNYFRTLKEQGRFNEFFNLHNNVELYYVETNELKNFASERGDFSNSLFEDFALIDKKIVLKKEKVGLGGAILFGQIRPYLNFFNEENWDGVSQLTKYHNIQNNKGYNINTIIELFKKLEDKYNNHES